jgi:hypothetical protein
MAQKVGMILSFEGLAGDAGCGAGVSLSLSAAAVFPAKAEAMPIAAVVFKKRRREKWPVSS